MHLKRLGALLLTSASLSYALFVEQPVGSAPPPQTGALRHLMTRLLEKEAQVVRKLFAVDSEASESVTWETAVNPMVLKHAATQQSFAEVKKTDAMPIQQVSSDVAAGSKSKFSTTSAFGSWTSAVAASVVLTVFTEFGDRTFFISGLLALKYPKVLVFTASSAALVVQTVFSTAVGHLCHLLPISGTVRAFPIDDYLAAILLLTFGCLHAKAAICGEPDTLEGEEDSRKAIHHDEEALNPYVEIKDNEAMTPSTNADEDARKSGGSSRLLQIDEVQPTSSTAFAKRQSVNAEFLEASRDVASLAREMEDATSFRIWRKIFWIIFIAELGDKSMFSTVALAAAQNPVGVFLGCSVAHCLVTLIAVIAGYMLQDYVSEWAANVAGAVLFFIFAALALMEGLARQGFKILGFSHASAAATTGAAFLITQWRSAKLKTI